VCNTNSRNDPKSKAPTSYMPLKSTKTFKPINNNYLV
jgi:hypothetical protein